MLMLILRMLLLAVALRMSLVAVWNVVAVAVQGQGSPPWKPDWIAALAWAAFWVLG